MHATRRPLAVLLLFGLAAATATWAGAQNQLATDAELQKAYNAASRTFPKLRSGEQQPAAADKDVMEGMAKWLVFRFASSVTNTPEKMAQLRRDFELQINGALTTEASKKNEAFRQQFGASLANAFRKLLDNDFQDYRYQIVNAAPMLVESAKLRSDAFGDFLAELIADHEAGKGGNLTNKHDLIKMFALRGLREYYGECVKSDGGKAFPPRPIVPVDATAILGNVAQKKMERDQRWVGAVLKFAENKPGVTKRPLEEQEAVRFLRREAIETLAATQAPMVAYGKKTVEAPIAPYLLRVLAPKTDLEPAPSLAEKVEAAIGIGQLRYKNAPDYHPEIGVYLVGQLIADFVTEANKDTVVISTGKPAAMHWRMDAKRLELALKDMAANAKGQPIEANARALEGGAGPMLKGMASSGKTLSAVNQGELNRFRKTVTTLRPKTNEVFKDIPAYKIDLGE